MTQPVYSPKQEQSGTATGLSPERNEPSMPATPDVAGSVGPPAQSQFPWPGRSEADWAKFDQAAQVFSSLAASAQNSPGSIATTAETGGVSNAGPA